jgi:hypothetical protein
MIILAVPRYFAAAVIPKQQVIISNKQTSASQPASQSFRFLFFPYHNHVF